ncbi:MAG: radical SAM protein [Magnetococcales bacterium]|nr:radical SAM protein [Magnetococcales bacterium]
MRILLVVYDNGGYTNTFPLGFGYISSVLLQEGVDVSVYSQDLHHYPDEHLTEYLNNNSFDIVAISVIAGYYQYKKLIGLSRAINRSRNRPENFILGGHGPSPEPEYFLKVTEADIVVMGEGEVTIKELIHALTKKTPLKDVLGIAYRVGNQIVRTGERPLIADLDSIPWPAYHLFPMEFYRLIREPRISRTEFAMPVLSARGCTFKCTFCYRMDKGLRNRSNQSIIEEIQYLQLNYRISYIGFYDELLVSSIERVTSFCEDLIKANLNISWNCNGRLNYALPEVLKLMKRAGCVYINYGIEAMDDTVLKNMKKGLRVDQIFKGIEATLAEGISPGFNIIFGNIGDNQHTLDKAVEFLLKYDDGSELRTIRPVTPYPGSPLYYHAIKKGLLKDCEDFYINKHTNSDLVAVNFTEMTDQEMHSSLFYANSRLIENYFRNQSSRTIDNARKLYLESDTSFRGFRTI